MDLRIKFFFFLTYYFLTRKLNFEFLLEIFSLNTLLYNIKEIIINLKTWLVINKFLLKTYDIHYEIYRYFFMSDIFN